MGFTTPNLDRIGKEGGVFVTYYGQQSCTVGRAAFITGQSSFCTGLTKVGLPGSPIGLKEEEQGYVQMQTALAKAIAHQTAR